MTQLTSWKGTLLDRVGDALRPILGLPSHVPLRCRDEAAERDPGLRLRVEIGEPGQQLVLRLREPTDGPALWKNPHLAVSHGPTSDPLSARLLAALPAQLQRQSSGPAWDAWAEALAQWRRSRAVPESEWAVLDSRELILRLLLACNQDCSFCWQSRTWPAAPDAILHGWIDEAWQLGRRQLTLSGGEPTLHPRLLEFVAHGKRLGMRVTLQSNAILLGRKPQLLRALVDAGVSAVVVSWHSPDPAASDEMTRAPGTHADTEAGIVACLQAGLGVTLNCVVDRRNVDTLPEHARQAVARFAQFAQPSGWLSVSYSHPNAPYARDQLQAMLVPLDEVAPKLCEALTILTRAGIVAQASGDCGFPACTLRQVPGLLPPIALHQGSDTGHAGRASLPVCAACAMRGHCVGPRTTYASVLGERGLTPFSQIPPDLGAQLPQALLQWWAGEP